MKSRTGRIAAVVAGVVMLSTSLVWGWGGSPTRPVSPEDQPAQVPDAPAPVITGAGRYEITGVDYHLKGFTSLRTGVRESTEPLKGDRPGDSVIVVRGTIHGEVAGSNATLQPLFSAEGLFPGLPKGCPTEVVAHPQQNGRQQNYVAYISFKDTAAQPECWRYFRTLRTLPLELKEVRAGKKVLPVLDGDRRLLATGPLLPKGGK
jgi:hypothetical protein